MEAMLALEAVSYGYVEYSYSIRSSSIVSSKQRCWGCFRGAGVGGSFC
jgi:hypothetical protein